ncbi:MAG: hypothetical protein KGJ55_06275 [Gammaproteobacteria bacterium]|nr:hypothetical protein [Gammaproteobacteria bacterium]
MSMPRATSAVLALLAGTLLAGCGWHPAGERPLPPALRVVYIDFSNAYDVTEPPVELALAQRLVSRGARVVADPQPGATVLKLNNLQERRDVLAIGQDGTAVEYRLTTQVSYELRDGRSVLIPEQTQSVSSEYSFNANQILAKEAEAKQLRDFIQGELADLLLLRLETQLNRPAAVAAPATAAGASPAS